MTDPIKLHFTIKIDSSDKRFLQDSLLLVSANPSSKASDIERLIHDGAHINKANGANKTKAIHLACGYGNSRVIKKLLELGADARSKTTQGYNALDIAIRRGDATITKIIENHLESEKQ